MHSSIIFYILLVLSQQCSSLGPKRVYTTKAVCAPVPLANCVQAKAPHMHSSVVIVTMVQSDTGEVEMRSVIEVVEHVHQHLYRCIVVMGKCENDFGVVDDDDYFASVDYGA